MEHECPSCHHQWPRRCPDCDGRRGALQAPRASACPVCLEERRQIRAREDAAAIRRAVELARDLIRGPVYLIRGDVAIGHVVALVTAIQGALPHVEDVDGVVTLRLSEPLE